VKRISNEDLPTPESPDNNTCRGMYASQVQHLLRAQKPLESEQKGGKHYLEDIIRRLHSASHKEATATRLSDVLQTVCGNLVQDKQADDTSAAVRQRQEQDKFDSSTLCRQCCGIDCSRILDRSTFEQFPLKWARLD
jgi:hypothetical protein